MDSTHLSELIMNSLCRICGEKKTDLISIMEQKFLLLKIHKCLPIEIKKDDQLSINICELCKVKINDSYLLYETCYNTDIKLKQIWKTLKEQIESSSSHLILTEGIEKENLNQLNSIQNGMIVGCDEKGVGGVLVINEIHIDSVCDEERQDNKNLEDDNPESIILITHPDEPIFASHGVLGENEGTPILLSSPEVCNSVFEDCDDTITNNHLIIESSTLQNEAFESHNTDKEICISESKTIKKKIECTKKKLGGEKFYQCQYCSKQLSTAASMSVHEATHSQEKLYLCDTCGKSFKHSSNLRSHVRTHLGIHKRYICQICQKSFLSNFFLHEHMNSHTGETPYKCAECGKEFREKIHLRQHKWTHSRNNFECSICGTKFNRKGNMSEHIKKYHGSNQEVGIGSNKANKFVEKVEETFSASCPVCSETLQNEEKFKIHMKTHSNDKCFFCPICGKKFRHSGSLTYHRRTAHTGEKPFQCRFCSEKFSLRSVQKIHERKKHTFECPYKCEICSSFFTNSSSLKNHSYVHLKEKLFECKECGKKFARSSNLSVHKKLHTGERQYTCEHCGKSYIQKHDMLKHKKIHDPKRNPFFCKFCGNSFAHKKDFPNHAICQLNYCKRNESCSAEKMLDSVTSDLEKDGRTLFEAEQLILESVEQFSRDRLQNHFVEEDCIYMKEGMPPDTANISELFNSKAKGI